MVECQTIASRPTRYAQTRAGRRGSGSNGTKSAIGDISTAETGGFPQKTDV